MSDKIEKLSEEELNTVLQFANALYNGNIGYYSPFMQTQNLLSLNGDSKKFTRKELLNALEQSPYDYTKLAEYSSFYETFDAIYTKTLRYLIGLLSFDLTYSCKNIKDTSEYSSKEYKDDLKRVYKFLDSFDYKHEFRKILKLMCTRDVVYTWFRDSHGIDSTIELDDKIKKDSSYAIQIMPQNYCNIDGVFNNSQYLYSIDMTYFLEPSVDINLFAPQLKQMLRLAYDGKENYMPSSQLNKRNGSFANYVQANPLDGAYCFKFDTSTFGIKPPFISLLKSCLSNDEIEQLQRDKNLLSAYEILAGEIQLLNNQKSEKADATAFKPQTLGALLALCTQALKKTNVVTSALPLANIKNYQFQDYAPQMGLNQLKSSSGQGASASELIFHTENLSQFAMQNAIFSDYCFMKQVYDQFSQFLNFYVNRKTKKYKFNFTLDGLDRDWHRETKLNQITKLSDKGMTLPPQYWASAIGVNVQDFARALEEAHYGDMNNNLTLLLNANTTSQQSLDSENGRPEKEQLDKSDKTENVEDYIN